MPEIDKKYKAIAAVILSVLSAVLYRMGGSSRWNTKFRDIGVSLCAVSLVYIFSGYWLWWSYLLSFGLLFGALTTYNKWASRIAGFDDDEVHAPSWFVTGLFYGLSFLPFAAFIDLRMILFRSLILALLTMAWSVFQGNAVREELGRGLCVTATVPLLLLL